MGKEFPGDVVSLDVIGTPTQNHIVSDILKWDFTVYPPTHFDMVWASPPCIQYSQARTTAKPRDLEGAENMLSRRWRSFATFPLATIILDSL